MIKAFIVILISLILDASLVFKLPAEDRYTSGATQNFSKKYMLSGKYPIYLKSTPYSISENGFAICEDDSESSFPGYFAAKLLSLVAQENFKTQTRNCMA